MTNDITSKLKSVDQELAKARLEKYSKVFEEEFNGLLDDVLGVYDSLIQPGSEEKLIGFFGELRGLNKKYSPEEFTYQMYQKMRSQGTSPEEVREYVRAIYPHLNLRCLGAYARAFKKNNAIPEQIQETVEVEQGAGEKLRVLERQEAGEPEIVGMRESVPIPRRTLYVGQDGVVRTDRKDCVEARKGERLF